MQNSNAFPIKMQEIMIEADELLVLQIKPPRGSIARQLSDCKIVHTVKIDSQTERQNLTKAITKGIEDGTDVARCFFPHHALTAKRGAETLELLICFHCFWLKAQLNGEVSNFPTTSLSESIFENLLPHFTLFREVHERFIRIFQSVHSYSYPIPSKIQNDFNNIDEYEAWLDENSQIEDVDQMRSQLQQLRGVLNERAKQKRER